MIRKLFSKDQRAFFTAHAPEGIGLDDLTMLGPINLMKLKFSPVDYLNHQLDHAAGTDPLVVGDAPASADR